MSATQFDRLLIGLQASLTGGAVNISLLGGYAPGFGTTQYQIITFSSINPNSLLGVTFNFPTLANTTSSSFILANGIDIQADVGAATPEPSTLLLLAGGLALLFERKRRSRRRVRGN